MENKSKPAETTLVKRNDRHGGAERDLDSEKRNQMKEKEKLVCTVTVDGQRDEARSTMTSHRL